MTARLETQYRTLCEKAYVAKAEALEKKKKKRDRVYDREANEHACKHAKLVVELKSLEKETHGEPEPNASSSDATLPSPTALDVPLNLGGGPIQVSPNNTSAPSPGAAGSSAPPKGEEGLAREEGGASTEGSAQGGLQGVAGGANLGVQGGASAEAADEVGVPSRTYEFSVTTGEEGRDMPPEFEQKLREFVDDCRC